MARRLDLVLGVLNGAVGDYLARTDNGLATPMECIHRGEPLPLTREALSHAHPEATPRVVMLLPGIMCTEGVWEFRQAAGAAATDRGSADAPTAVGAAVDTDYGRLLARDLGFTPLYLRYNTGLAIPDNGALLARLLETLVDEYPVPIEEIMLLGFSMGGLVARSACHVARQQSHRWLGLVGRAIYLGTPHRGAPLERVGRVVASLLQSVDDPVTRLLADVGNLRSDGVKDLGDADLRHEDRARRRPTVALRDPEHPVALLPEIRHYLVAGTLSPSPWLTALFGDSIVPVGSATDGLAAGPEAPALPSEHVKIVRGLAHMTLAHSPAVYAHIRAWCEESS
jgi:triacylglycerol lipase